MTFDEWWGSRFVPMSVNMMEKFEYAKPIAKSAYEAGRESQQKYVSEMATELTAHMMAVQELKSHIITCEKCEAKYVAAQADGCPYCRVEAVNNHHFYMQDRLQADVERLLAENARMRDALEKIAYNNGIDFNALDMIIARQALKGE